MKSCKPEKYLTAEEGYWYTCFKMCITEIKTVFLPICSNS